MAKSNDFLLKITPTFSRQMLLCGKFFLLNWYTLFTYPVAVFFLYALLEPTVTYVCNFPLIDNAVYRQDLYATHIHLETSKKRVEWS